LGPEALILRHQTPQKHTRAETRRFEHLHISAPSCSGATGWFYTPNDIKSRRICFDLVRWGRICRFGLRCRWYAQSILCNSRQPGMAEKHAGRIEAPYVPLEGGSSAEVHGFGAMASHSRARGYSGRGTSHLDGGKPKMNGFSISQWSFLVRGWVDLLTFGKPWREPHGAREGRCGASARPKWAGGPCTRGRRQFISCMNHRPADIRFFSYKTVFRSPRQPTKRTTMPSPGDCPDFLWGAFGGRVKHGRVTDAIRTCLQFPGGTTTT